MWKIRLKTVGNLIVILVSVLLQLWIYRFIYQESKENRMTFMVIGEAVKYSVSMGMKPSR